MPSSFTWTLTVNTGSYFDAPTGGPGVSGVATSKSPRKSQFVRGIKFANVPDSNADNVVHGGPRVWHVNSVQNVKIQPVQDFNISGVVNSRFLNPRCTSVPKAVSAVEYRSVDRFENTIFSAISGSH